MGVAVVSVVSVLSPIGSPIGLPIGSPIGSPTGSPIGLPGVANVFFKSFFKLTCLVARDQLVDKLPSDVGDSRSYDLNSSDLLCVNIALSPSSPLGSFSSISIDAFGKARDDFCISGFTSNADDLLLL